MKAAYRGGVQASFSNKVIRRVEANVVTLLQPGSFADPLTEVLRNGAQALLAQAVEAEVGDFSPSISIWGPLLAWAARSATGTCQNAR